MIEDKFTDPATLSCPFKYLDEVRSEKPVFFSESLGSYVVTRYKDAMQVLTNPTIYSSAPDGDGTFMINFSPKYHALYEEAGVPPLVPALVVTDGERHRRYRDHVDRFFTAAAARRLEAGVDEIIDMLIDGFIDDGYVDLYERFCLLLPLYVICDLLGLPRSDTKLFQAAGDVSVRLAGAAMESEESRVRLHKTEIEFHKYLAVHIARVRANPDGSVLSDILHTVPADGRPIDDTEIMSLIMTFNAGGNETTTNGLGNMLWLALQQPQLLAELRSNRSHIPKFVDEALRLQSPVAAVPRWVLADTELAGVPIPAGSNVMVSITAVNRDGAQFGCPENLDLTRKGLRNHLAFGTGIHYCLGANLARVELIAAMNRILDRLEDIVIDAPTVPGHQPKIIVRALWSLPIRFRRAEPAPS